MKNNLIAGRVAARWMAFGVIACSVIGYVLADKAIPANFQGQLAEINFVLEGWSTVFIIAAAVCAWILRHLQRGIYWFFWLQTTKIEPDERQRAVRQRVFERAYGIMLAGIVLIMLAMGDLLSNSNEVYEGLALRLMWIVIIVFISLPSILAAWQKDS